MTSKSFSVFQILVDYLLNTEPNAPQPVLQNFTFFETDDTLMFFNENGEIYGISNEDGKYVFYDCKYPSINYITTTHRNIFLKWALNEDKTEIVDTIIGTQTNYSLLYYYLYITYYYCIDQVQFELDIETLQYNQWHKEFKSHQTDRLYDRWCEFEYLSTRI